MNANENLREDYLRYNREKEAESLQSCNIHGCTNMFRADVPGKTWCTKCAWKIKRGICPSCNNKSEHLSPAGMCPACETHYYSERFAMVDTNAYVKSKCACGSNESPVEGQVCNIAECLEAHSAHLCGQCMEVMIPSTLEICHRCFKQNYNDDREHI